MNATWTPNPKQVRNKRRNRRLSLALLVLLVIFFGYSIVPKRETFAHTDENLEMTVPETDANPSLPATATPPNVFVREISNGDTLSGIFDEFEIDQQTMCLILAADEPLLALDVLRPGNRLTFSLDEAGEKLESLELFIHRGHKVVYQRVDQNHFEYNDIELPGEWRQELISGDIHGSFIISALEAGLTEQEAANIAELLESRLDFRREMRAGDRFQIIRSSQYVDGEETGQSHILGIRLDGQRYQHDAFLFEDGNYYDHSGKSLARAFRRYPFAGHYRISSPFNPRRRHPITKRISPHNGTDFAMSTGTAVLAAGDGVITRVKNHPYAGKYVEIQHGGSYKTRYLHLSRILVKRGQKVERGQRIALSGNTGRSTGPHLHFELHVKGRVVNPLKAKIPLAASIPPEKLPHFKERVAKLTAFMEQPDAPQQIAKMATGKNDSI